MNYLMIDLKGHVEERKKIQNEVRRYSKRAWKEYKNARNYYVKICMEEEMKLEKGYYKYIKNHNCFIYL